MTKWLDGTWSDRRGLGIAGGPRGLGADLLIGAAAVHVVHGDREAKLRWRNYSKTVRAGVPGSWSLTYWGGSAQGIGVDGPDSLTPVREGVLASPRVRSAGYNPLNKVAQRDRMLPLWASTRSPSWVLWQKPEVEALLQLLTDNEGVRTRLQDPACTRQLAIDLSAKPTSTVTGQGWGVTPSTGAVMRALDGLGYVFKYGRPLPLDPKDPLEVVVDKVLTRLASNPRDNTKVNHQRVAKLVKSRYVDLAPWPFGALGV